MHHSSDPAVTTFRHSRWASGFYLVAGTLNCCFAIAFLILAFANADEHTSWRNKVWAVTGSAVAALSLALWGLELILSGRAAARTWVKVGEQGVSLRMPIPDGDLTWVGPEIHLAWDKIESVSLREKTCTIHAGGERYKLDARNCSDPRKLAELLAARKGISLTPASLRAK
jgi:hypothetical protein